MRLSEARSGADFFKRALLRAREAERQRGLDRARKATIALMGAARRPPHRRAYEPQGELTGEQFVERQTLARRMLGREGACAFRPMRGAQCLGESGELIGGEDARVLPFGERGQTRQSLFRRA